MKPVVFGLLLGLSILALTACDVNIFSWAHNPEWTEHTDSIMRDAQNAYSDGDWEKMEACYTRVIDLLGDPDWEPWDGIENIAAHTDITDNIKLSEAYAGRATAQIRQYFGWDRIINMVEVLMPEDGSQVEPQHILQVIFGTEGGTEEEALKTAEEAYMKIAPIVVFEGEPVLEEDIRRKNEAAEFRQSIGQDLYLAAHYSQISNSNAAAINYHFNFTFASVLSVIMTLCDTNLNSKFMVEDTENPGEEIRDPADILYVGINESGQFDIDLKTFIDVDMATDPEELMVGFEELASRYQPNSDGLNALNSNPDQAQEDLELVDAAIDLLGTVSNFQHSLQKVTNYVIDSYENVILKIAGRNQIESVLATDETTVLWEDTNYESYSGTDPLYNSMKELNTTLYQSVFNNDEAYNQALKAAGKDFTTLYSIFKTLDDLDVVYSFLIAFKVTIETVIDFLDQTGSIDPATLFNMDNIDEFAENIASTITQDEAEMLMDALDTGYGDLFSEQTDTQNISGDMVDVAKCAICDVYPTMEECASLSCS